MENKVLIITLNSFKNDSRVLKEATTLAIAGYKVVIICFHESGQPEFEELNRFEVHRIVKVGDYNKLTIFRKFFCWICFLVKSLSFKGFHLTHCNDLNSLPIGVVHKALYSSKILYDCHEYETELSHVNGCRKFVSKLVEKALIKFADGVITVSDSIAESYMRNYAIKKPRLVLNCPYKKKVEKTHYFHEKFNIPKNEIIFIYQGVLSAARGIYILMEVFKNLPAKHLILMGSGSKEHEIQAVASKSNNIHLHKMVKVEEILEYTAAADFGILITRDKALSVQYSLPNKVFEYYMAGIPVLCSNLLEVTKLINSFKSGIVLDENDVEAMQGIIVRITKKDVLKYSKGIPEIQSIYNWQNQEKILLKEYKRIIQSRD